MESMQLDTLIFGGGAAGLWLLDELVRRGERVVLLEAGELGGGQTVASQGIIHGGLKYTLHGLLTRSAARIREMPLIWRDCLAGQRPPDLSGTRLRSPDCLLWRTDSVASRVGMIGARFGLCVAPEFLPAEGRPAVLAACPGVVARLAEPVISPQSFVADLAARHRDRILRIDPHYGTTFTLDAPGHVRTVGLTNPAAQSHRQPHARLKLQPRDVILTAGSGNAELRRQLGLPTSAMQRRPLHMVMLRGDLPRLNGHCVDGARTRVTVTSDTDSNGRTIWQVGGQLAEEGVELEAEALIARTRTELQATIPGLDLSTVEGATYRIDRAEKATTGKKRPDGVQVLREGNVLTAWPTKLALVPQLAHEVSAMLGSLESPHSSETRLPDEWPRPEVALPPWETCNRWLPLEHPKTPENSRKRAA